jgi:hypothetical protein
MGAVRLYAAPYKSSNAKMIKNHLNKDDFFFDKNL